MLFTCAYFDILKTKKTRLNDGEFYSVTLLLRGQIGQQCGVCAELNHILSQILWGRAPETYYYYYYYYYYYSSSSSSWHLPLYLVAPLSLRHMQNGTPLNTGAGENAHRILCARKIAVFLIAGNQVDSSARFASVALSTVA